MIYASRLKFAEAIDDYSASKYVIVGAPFDATESFRAGARFAPNRIREVSYNFESYLCEHEIDISEIPFYDYGNIEEQASADTMIQSVYEILLEIYPRFPILIGGEHSITIGAVKCLLERVNNLFVIVMDAHLDFRNQYLGLKNSHACVLRRIIDMVGYDNLLSIGVRSYSKEEKIDAEKNKLRWYTTHNIYKKGINETIAEIDKIVKNRKIYLSLDIDCIDPCYAPGVSNPEPFGLSAIDVISIIRHFSSQLVGFDITEISPPYDNGDITSILGARIIYDILAIRD